MKEKLAAWFWRNRSWKGKTAVIVGSVFLALLVIGFAVPAPDEDSGTEATPATQTEEAATEAATPQPLPPPPLPAVERVIDGDTIRLDTGDTVRLVQIDAPDRDGECFGAKSTRVLRQLLPVGAEIRVASDPKLDATDRNGRLLRYVFNGRKNINLVLVQRGAASVWFFNGDRGRFADKLLVAAERAQAEGRGAWGACQARLIADEPFRTRAKQVAQTLLDSSSCDPSYPDFCIPPPPPDLDCADVGGAFSVTGSDPHGFDGDFDGVGCESG